MALQEGKGGVVYLKGVDLENPDGLAAYQAFINLIPLTFMSLRMQESGETTRAVEVDG